MIRVTPKDEVFEKCPIDKLKKNYVEFTNKINDLVEVTEQLEENYFKQDIFGSSLSEDIKIVSDAIEIADSYLDKLIAEQSTVSKCLEETTIEWEENLAKCNIEERDDCDEIESFLEEIKKMRGRK